MKALVTGSGGLIGSACVRLLGERGWQVAGVDNNMRRVFFGPEGSTEATTENLKATVRGFRHFGIDIRDRQAIRELFEAERPDFIVHAAAQPSHEKAAEIPHDDFDVNAVGTMNLLMAARDYCAESPFCFTSTNKVYGDRPNGLALVERETRFDYANGRAGIDESMPIDQSMHTVFGASKVSADVMCQEFGRGFGMPVGVFRGGCLTGPQHAAVRQHGYLPHIVACAVAGRPYRILGYKGKQVRDQLHCRDVAELFLEFHRAPRAGEVYNLGGGRANSVSLLETVAMLEAAGHKLAYEYDEKHRPGDHICYITDLAKVHAHFPDWQVTTGLPQILEELVACGQNR